MYKVMIADDEHTIQDGLVSFIDWSALNCEIASLPEDGLQAREQLHARPIDILIADIRMPGLDGLQLAEHVRENQLDTAVILLTGYADFSYAQAAIRAGVTEYIVKNSPLEKIRSAVERAIQLIQYRRDQRVEMENLKTRMNDNLEEAQSKFLHDVACGLYADGRTLMERGAALEIEVNNYFVMAFSVHGCSDRSIDSAGTRNQFISSLRDFLRRTLNNRNPYIVVQAENRAFAVVSSESQDYAAAISKVALVVEQTILMSQSAGGVSLSVGVSDMHYALSELPEAYRDAELANERGMRGEARVPYSCVSYTVSRDERARNRIPWENLSAWIDGLEYKSSEKLDSELGAMLRDHSELTPADLHRIGLQIHAQCCNYSMRESLPILFDRKERLREILTAPSRHAIRSSIRDVVHSVLARRDEEKGREEPLIEKIRQFVVDHFSEDIGLDSIAEQVCLSRSYLSRRFKQEAGRPLSEYINAYRISRAKEYLLNTDNTVSEVSYMVGFHDPSYFSKVFKQYEGITPGSFRVQNNRRVSETSLTTPVHRV